MTDDIVTRLLDFTPLKDADLARLMLDAADEIQQLQTELAHTKQQLAYERSMEFD